MLINSYVDEGMTIPEFSQGEIKDEPMFFRADYDFAMEHGGPITKTFLSYFIRANRDFIFDSRVHMLMPGWWPSIPGWHHDSVERGGPGNQPIYDYPKYRASHAFALVGPQGLCQTEFAVGTHDIEIPAEGEIVYKVWNDQVQDLVEAQKLKTVSVESSRVYWFDDRSWHRAVPAAARGFRWFGRVTWDSPMKAMNEIRKQSQVYLEFPMDGW